MPWLTICSNAQSCRSLGRDGVTTVHSVADPAAVQHAIWNFACSQRNRHTQSVHRMSFRFTHAPYVKTASACGANCTFTRSMVRTRAFRCRRPVVGDFRQRACQHHPSSDAGYIFVFLYSSEKADPTLHVNWCVSWRSATPDRMRCRDGQNNLGGFYAILFLRRFQHFMSIAWMYRDESGNGDDTTQQVHTYGPPETRRQVSL